jgi:hypothetical protein
MCSVVLLNTKLSYCTWDSDSDREADFGSVCASSEVWDSLIVCLVIIVRFSIKVDILIEISTQWLRLLVYPRLMSSHEGGSASAIK